MWIIDVDVDVDDDLVDEEDGVLAAPFGCAVPAACSDDWSAPIG